MNRIDRISFVNNFVSELEKAKNNSDSSISWIGVPIRSIKSLTDFDYTVTIGGTNIIVFKNSLQITNFTINELRSGHELIQKIVNHLPHNITSLAINLAFPVQQYTTQFGICAQVLRNVKGHNLDDILNKDLQMILLIYLPNLKRIQIINDVIELVHKNYIHNNSTAGLVLGTGFNVGLIFKECIINLECGNFDKFNPLPSTLLIDAQSTNPKTQLLEKEIAGKYLFHHYNIIAGQKIFENSGQLSNCSDTTANKIFNHCALSVLAVKESIERFVSPTKVKWAHEGALISELIESNRM